MATDFAYTFHVRAENYIAEQVFSIILEAGMQYGDDQSGINYSQDEQGFGLQFCGVATDEPESKLRTWLTEFSAGGVEIDWMMLSNDGGCYTACSSFIKGEEITHLDAATWIPDWSEAILVGKALDGNDEALSKIPDLILSYDGDCGANEYLWGYLTLFEALANAGRLNARTEDVEEWSEILFRMTNPDEYECPLEGCEALFTQIESAIETRKRLDEVLKGDFVTLLEQIDISSLDEWENKGLYADEGVYCAWNDNYYSSSEDAIDLFMENKRAVRASFEGWLQLKDCRYIENSDNSGIAEVGYTFENAMSTCRKFVEWVKDRFTIDLKSVEFSDWNKAVGV